MEMKTRCEGCGEALQPDGVAYICSYECTWCDACAEKMKHVCPNCKGELVRRPKRSTQIIR